MTFGGLATGGDLINQRISRRPPDRRGPVLQASDSLGLDRLDVIEKAQMQVVPAQDFADLLSTLCRRASATSWAGALKSIGWLFSSAAANVAR